VTLVVLVLGNGRGDGGYDVEDVDIVVHHYDDANEHNMDSHLYHKYYGRLDKYMLMDFD
jgi:hypothetical protein